MKKYYYVCPRCGRTWVRYIPRAQMKCKFCEETWKTKGRKGTRSRFSFTATLLWLFWIAVILFGGYKALVKFNVIPADAVKVPGVAAKQDPATEENALPETDAATEESANDESVAEQESAEVVESEEISL